jgi:hypothetical protein
MAATKAKRGMNGSGVPETDPDELVRETIAMFDNLLGGYAKKEQDANDNVLLSKVID